MELISKDIYAEIVRKDIEQMTCSQPKISERENSFVCAQEIIKDIVSRDIDAYFNPK